MIEPFQIIRSRRKTLSISVDCFARLIVRAPLRYEEERIFSFLKEKEAWITRQIQKMERAGMRLPPENLDGYTFLLLGKSCQIRLVNERYIRFDSENSVVYLPEKNARKRLVSWLKENAERIVRQITEQTARRMGVSYQSVKISSAKTRWGSCSRDNAIRYSFRLLYAPKEVIEYVTVHELAHVKHKNHSPAFWREVERYAPDYKARRKWLKEHGILMEIF